MFDGNTEDVLELEQLVQMEVLTAAPRLVGSVMTTNFDNVETSIQITETEAYRPDDPASHSYRGRTLRTASMFASPGALYVYRSYGIHWCANLVVSPTGAAVLLRAGVPLSGIDSMASRRGRIDHLVDGPGKLTQALGIDGTHDGLDVLTHPLIEVKPLREPTGVVALPRVGISKAVDKPWRFVLRR